VSQDYKNNAAPKYSHYVSLENGGIYPAMTSPSGYEDQHLTEWRGANPAEVEKYLRGETAVDVSPLPISPSPVFPLSSPTTLQLAPEDPAPPIAPAPPAAPVQPIAEAPIVPPAAPVIPRAPAE
jgi:hypothetical protein